MSQPAHVLVMDSGVGALSIIAELRRQLPSVSITYASDNGFYPYGTKPEAQLVQRVRNLFDVLIAQCQPDIAVVACNTASTVALPEIRKHFSLPIVGVVPAIKPAALKSQTGVFGLLATPATIERPYTDELIAQHALNCDVIRLGSAELVDLAEKKLRGITIAQHQLEPIVAPMMNHPKAQQMDTIVLACTHFPLLKEELKPLFPESMHWLDSGEAIAKRVVWLMNEHQLSTEGTPSYQSIFTKEDPKIEQLGQQLAERLPGPVTFIDVPEPSTNR